MLCALHSERISSGQMLACISPIWACAIEHTQPGLTDTATDRQGQRISHQAFVEIEFQTFFFTFLLELTLEGFFVYADTH